MMEAPLMLDGRTNAILDFICQQRLPVRLTGGGPVEYRRWGRGPGVRRELPDDQYYVTEVREHEYILAVDLRNGAASSKHIYAVPRR